MAELIVKLLVDAVANGLRRMPPEHAFDRMIEAEADRVAMTTEFSTSQAQGYVYIMATSRGVDTDSLTPETLKALVEDRLTKAGLRGRRAINEHVER